MSSFVRVTIVLIGAGASLACGASAPAIRVLHAEPPVVRLPAREESVPEVRPVTTEQVPAPAPRIGAPGGSGAGSRRVAPAQSGNDTVGGLPAGIGGGSGPAGRG